MFSPTVFVHITLAMTMKIVRKVNNPKRTRIWQRKGSKIHIDSAISQLKIKEVDLIAALLSKNR